MLEVCVIGSGSSGNCIYVASASTAILVDAGLSAREISKRLKAVDIDPLSISALCITHEHHDHISGVRVFHKNHGKLSLFCNRGTMEAMKSQEQALPWNIFTECIPFTIGDLTITPFPIPHDASAPVGFRIASGGSCVGIATDLGMHTPAIRHHLADCQLLVLEANHDTYMLENSNRPWHLKQRIAGRMGHLSNDMAAELLMEIINPHLQDIFLAHLSSECNTADMAHTTIRRTLDAAGHTHIRLHQTHAVIPSCRIIC